MRKAAAHAGCPLLRGMWLEKTRLGMISGDNHDYGIRFIEGLDFLA